MGTDSDDVQLHVAGLGHARSLPPATRFGSGNGTAFPRPWRSITGASDRPQPTGAGRPQIPGPLDSIRPGRSGPGFAAEPGVGRGEDLADLGMIEQPAGLL